MLTGKSNIAPSKEITEKQYVLQFLWDYHFEAGCNVAENLQFFYWYVVSTLGFYGKLSVVTRQCFSIYSKT